MVGMLAEKFDSAKQKELEKTEEILIDVPLHFFYFRNNFNRFRIILVNLFPISNLLILNIILLNWKSCSIILFFVKLTESQPFRHPPHRVPPGLGGVQEATGTFLLVSI